MSNPLQLAQSVQGFVAEARDVISFLDVTFTGAMDVVGVYDSSFNQIFQTARPMKVLVREHARPMEHPVETGQVITDYRVILPIEIDMQMVLQGTAYKGAYQQVRHFYLTAELLTVQTKACSYSNLIIAEMPHEEDPEKYDALTMALRFKEVIVPEALSSFAPKDVTQSDTQQLGEQNGTVSSDTPSASTESGLQ